MPKAVVNISDTERIELKSISEGFVVLRRLTYGEYLNRRAMGARMTVQAGKGKDFEGELALVNEAVTRYEFANCIVEHNLEKDDNGTLFDFKKPADLSMLDPRVGEEISINIDRMNQFEEDGESGNF